MALWAIPDIHGRFDRLSQLWQKLGPMVDFSRDKVIYLGDLVDRGYEVVDVLRFVKKQCEEYPDRVICLKGNHENFLTTCYSVGATYSDWELWFYEGNGGKTSHSSLMAIDSKERMDLVDWLRGRPLFHEETGFFFSHAPVPRERLRNMVDKGKPFTEKELIWSYSPDEFGFARNFKKDDGRDVIGVCGHIHKLRENVLAPRLYEHYYFLDAGCGCAERAPLIAMEVRTRELVEAWPEARP